MSQSETKCIACNEPGVLSFLIPGETQPRYLCKTCGSCRIEKKDKTQGMVKCEHPAKMLIMDASTASIAGMACGIHKGKLEEQAKKNSNFVTIAMNPAKGGKTTSAHAAPTQQPGLTGPIDPSTYASHMPGVPQLQVAPVPGFAGQEQKLVPVPTPASAALSTPTETKVGTGKCQATFASGQKKGQVCGKNVKDGGLYCGMHSKKGGSTPTKTAPIPAVAGSSMLPPAWGMQGLPQAVAATKPKIEKPTFAPLGGETDYRIIVGNGAYSQSTRMVIKKGSGVDVETHPDFDQIIILLNGQLKIRTLLPNETEAKDSDLTPGGIGIIPAGVQHTIVNNGNDDAILYSIYTKPNHHLKDEKEGPVVTLPELKSTPPLKVEAPSGVPTVDLKSQTSVPTTAPLDSGSLTSQLPPTVPTASDATPASVPKPVLPAVPTLAVTEQH